MEIKKINALQQKIDDTKYWDMPILDIQTKYFGDEIYVYIEHDDHTCWKISFLICADVKYETDAGWRPEGKPKQWWRPAMKELSGTQIGYWGQDIVVNQNPNDADLLDSSLDLTSMFMHITCRDIQVEQLDMAMLDFFWQHEVEK